LAGRNGQDRVGFTINDEIGHCGHDGSIAYEWVNCGPWLTFFLLSVPKTSGYLQPHQRQCRDGQSGLENQSLGRT
jgi:hypothetical protein